MNVRSGADKCNKPVTIDIASFDKMILSAVSRHNDGRKLVSHMIRTLLIVIGAVLVLDTLLVVPNVRFNAGVIMPAILGLPPFIWGIFYPDLQRLSAQGVFLTVKWLLLAAYGLFFLTFTLLSASILRSAHAPATGRPDALLVLGASIRAGKASRTLALRLDKAIEVLRGHPGLPIVVSGGRGPGEAEAEADVMARYLSARGVAEDQILVEDQSVNTFENLSLSWPLIRLRTGQPDPAVSVVTSGLHLYRAMRMAERAGFKAIGIAAADLWYLVPNTLLREYLAVIKHHLRGI